MESVTYLSEITEEMETFNSSVAPGSECNAWADYVGDACERLGMEPWDGRAEWTAVPEDFAEYWLAAAECSNIDYDKDGGRLDIYC